MIHSRRSRGLACWVVALLGACALAGCGKEDGRLSTQPVTGKVTLDGKSLANAEIWLVPTSEDVKNAKMTVRPAAKSGADGTFTLSSYVSNDGAPVGDYAVMVVKTGMKGESDDEDAEGGGKEKTFAATVKAMNNSGFPAKYGNPTTSGLTFTVRDGPNQLDLALKSK